MQSSSKSSTTKPMITQAENKIDDKEVIETTSTPVTSNEKAKAVTNSPQSESASPETKRNRKGGTSSSAVSSSPTKESQNKNVKPMKKVDRPSNHKRS